MAENKKKKPAQRSGKSNGTAKNAKKTNNKKNTKPSNNSQREEQEEGGLKVNGGEIFRWTMGILAFFIIFTFFPVFDSGIFGKAISTALKGVFGPMYYVVPFIMILVVIFWGRDRKNKVAGIKLLLYILEFVFISVVVHVAVAGDEPILLSQLYDTGVALESAGVVGGAIAIGFTTLIGSNPAIILSILGIFICTVLLCGTTPKATVMAIVNYFRDAVNRARENDGEEYDDEEEAEDPTTA